MRAPIKPALPSPPPARVQVAIALALALAKAYRPATEPARWRRLARALEDAALPAIGALAMDGADAGAGTVGT